MKKLSLFSIFAILIFTFGSEYLMACHEEASSNIRLLEGTAQRIDKVVF